MSLREQLDELIGKMESKGVMTRRPGRPGRPTTNPLTSSIRVRVSPAQQEKFNSLGGSEWLRAVIDAAVIQQKAGDTE